MSFSAPVHGRLHGAIARKSPLASAGVGGGPSAFSAAKAAIVADAGDVNILVVGDSTGNETTEWVYLFAEWLGDEYPTHSVSYHAWDTGAADYAAAVSISTGSGANTINVWNASAAGYRPNSMFGSDYANAIAGRNADLVIFNHGHNVLHTQRDRIIEGAFVGPMETVLQEYPGVGIAMILQNPNRDDSNMDNVIAAQRRYAAQRTDIRLIDVYSEFVALGKPSSLYVDNVHPSASGTQIFLGRVQSAWRSAARTNSFTTATSWLSQTATNVVSNGRFATFTPPSAPTGWTLLSSATNDKDLVVVDSGDTYSLKLTNGAASLGRLYQLFSTGLRDSLKGKVVSLAARVYRPAASSNFAGQVAFTVTSTAAGTVEYTQAVNAYTKAGWYWEVIPNVAIPNDTTSIEIRLFADSTNSGNSSNYGRVVIVEGDQPRNAA